jgi:DNA repair exonuclease SbcCD ATPase subunit
MKLSKALKVKNRLKSELHQLQDRVKQFNSYDARNVAVYDTKELLQELQAKAEELADLKARIEAASQPIRKAILLVGEVKSQLALLKELDTKHGKFTESGGWREEPKEVEFIAQITRQGADDETTKLMKKLEDLQDEIDRHNATTDLGEGE